MKNRHKISDLRATITDEELKAFKNFESVLAEREAYFDAKTNVISQLKRLLIGVGVITTLVLSLVVLNQDNNTPVDKPEGSDALLTTPDSISLKKETVPTKETIQKSEEEASKVKPKSPVQVKEEPSIKAEDTHIDQEPVESDSVGKPIGYKYNEAQPVDGLPALYKYFEGHLKYPETAVADSVEGSVFVQFTISKGGKPVKITIEQSLGELFDKEAIRLIENMPLWHPATINSQPIESKIRIPIHFSIKEIRYE